MGAAITNVARNQSLVRGLGLLRELASRPSGATVPELAEAAALPRTTASRLLMTLLELGAVERVDSRLWKLGPEIARLGRVADPFQRLRSRAQGTVGRLAQDVGESAMIAVIYDTWENETVLQVNAENWAGATSWLGIRHRGALHASASGKLALAALDRELLPDVVGVLESFTPKTIVDLDRLERELDAVRARGWASTIDELETGLTAVAVAVDDPITLSGAGARALNLSVSGLSARLPAKQLPEIAERVRDAAIRLARDLHA